MKRSGYMIEGERGHAMSSFLLFLIGLLSETRVYFMGCVALSELAIFFIAPLVFLRIYGRMKRDGFMQLIGMQVMFIVAMFFSSWVNHTEFPYIVKKFAQNYAGISYCIVLYTLLRNNLKGLRWVLVGVFFSSLITIFAFNPQAQISSTGFAYIGNEAIEDVVDGPLFWITRFTNLIQIPVCGFYLQFPLCLSVILPFSSTIVSALTTVSGRSASLVLIMASVMIIVGGKSRTRMRRMGRHILIVFLSLLVLAFLFKEGYKYAALHDWLSEDARSKYENQTSQGSGMLALLMSGRQEFFIAIPAIIDRPILGYGLDGEDTRNYVMNFYVKHFDGEVLQRALSRYQRALATGQRMFIPAHSCILGAWLRVGIFGLIYWLWYLWLIFKYVRRYSSAIPQWFGFFAMMLPSTLWNIFFSPGNNSRLINALILTCLFFSMSVAKGKIVLPYSMEMEARKYE